MTHNSIQSSPWFSRCKKRLAGMLVLAGCMTSTLQAQTVVQTYFIPFDENEVHVALNTIDDFDGAIGSSLRSTISIVGGITNTILYWDHWEDGYEGNLISPTQLTTQVWGDNNPANGIPPGFVNDRVDEGDIISLINDIPIPRNTTNILYDARDKMSVTRWVAMSRYLYAPNPGEVLADSAQIYDRSKYGFNFRAPVGINTGTNQMFEYSSIMVSAGYNSTVVRFDSDADGIIDETVFLDEGDHHVIRFITEGAGVFASKPIQAHMITGDIGSNYEMRFFELFSDNQWDSSYYTSMFTANNIPTEIFMFNPNTNEIDITFETLTGTTNVVVPAMATASYVVPTNTGVNLYTTNGQVFIPVSATDARQGTSGNQAHDWGHALVPLRALTTVSIVPWAPGSGGNPITVNGNPVWVTAESNTTLFVDWDGDSSTGPLIDAFGRRYDFSTNIVRLQVLRLYDSSDNDQTGMRMYTTNGTRFATTWGQDPATAPTGNPYLDMGMAVFPFPTVPAVKEWALYEDVNTNGVVNPGDSIQFTIYVVNVGYADANDVIVFDTGALNTTYELNSTYVNEVNESDDVVPPAETEFPLDEMGLNVGTIPIGHTATVTYVVMINDPFPTNTDGIVNGVYVDNETQVFVPIPIPGFEMTKSSTPTNPVQPNDSITYFLDIVNTGNIYQTGVQLNDQLPTTVTYVPNSTRIVVNGQFDGSFVDDFHVLDEYNGTDGSLFWSSDWLEVNESDGPGSGDLQVLADDGAAGDVYMLQIQNANHGVYRRADLGQFTNAVLEFDFRRESLESGEFVTVAASVNGGSSWNTVYTIDSSVATDADYISTNFNISAYLSTNFAVRFIANSTMSNADRVFIDNVAINVSGSNVTNIGGATPLLLSNYALNSGQTMRVSFDVTVNGGISVSSVVNRAYVTSFNSPAPLEAAVTNWVILPVSSRIAGYVRNDLDADGDVAELDPGIGGVSISLFTDPNSDGNPADGVVVASANTDAGGFFDLGYFLSNSYVVLETDPINFISVADSDGGNPNLISFTTASGLDFTNNVFLDTRRAALGGQVRYDEDGDGNLNDADPGLAGVLVDLYTDPNADGNPADGAYLATQTTDVNGYFTFNNVNTGSFVIVENDPDGMISTADSGGVNDNLIYVFMPGGLVSTNHAFLDTSSGLSITKSASPPGIWFPNLQARYTITVLNTGVYTHTGVTISDYLDTGLVYVADSSYITATVLTSNSVADTFSSVSYNNNNGSVSWNGSWVESDGGGGGAGGGAVLISSSRLNITDIVSGVPEIRRSVNLSAAVSATLIYDYDTSSGVDSTDDIRISISTDGSSWTELYTYEGAVSGQASFDITEFADTNTTIRFHIIAGYSGSSEYFEIDDVQIVWESESIVTSTGAPPPAMVSGYTLTPGDSITIVFTAEVAMVESVTNTACVTSSVLSNGLCATVVNLVDTGATPDRISGQVRFDIDGDGDLLDNDFGISGVTLSLYTDPNGDGDPADGVFVDSTTTEFYGYYIFGQLTNGNYVVVESDISGYESTGDSQGANDNRIAVNLPGGIDSRDNDFLDRTISGLTISKTTPNSYIVVPGETIQYSIIVSNTRSTGVSGVRVIDALPEGVTYMNNSARIAVSGVSVSNSVMDLFNARAYTNHDGSVEWNGNWNESSDDNNVAAGDVYVISDFGSYSLHVRDDGNSIRRSANISGGTYATLSYYYRRAGLEAGEYVACEISTDDNNWDELARHGNDGSSTTTDGSYQFASHDIIAYASTNTYIRFRSPSGGMSDGDGVYFDDIKIDFGYTLNISTNANPPPYLASNITLSGGAYLIISFTTEVTFADTIMNTGVVYTALDTNGLRAYASNFVGNIVMTQGMVLTQSSDLLAVRVGWSAYTNEQGQVSKEYDVMYVDDGVTGFHPALTNYWEWVATINNSIFVDTGSVDRIPPSHMGNKMRFYRASFKGIWGDDKPVRYATREIYVAKCIDLEEGENFMSLFMIPDENKLSAVFGTDRLPAGDTMGNSTRIEWYASNPQSEATNVVWLSDAGVWQHAEGGIANDMPLPLSKGFNIILPPGSGNRELVLVGQVPTNTSPETGHAPAIAANESYTIVSYNIPYRIKLQDSGLKEAGFTGVQTGRPFNPRYSDEIRIMTKGGGSMEQPDYRILLNSSGQFQYWTGGSGSAENHVLEPDDAIVIYTKMSLSNFTWNINIPYPEPTPYMTP